MAKNYDIKIKLTPTGPVTAALPPLHKGATRTFTPAFSQLEVKSFEEPPHVFEPLFFPKHRFVKLANKGEGVAVEPITPLNFVPMSDALAKQATAEMERGIKLRMLEDLAARQIRTPTLGLLLDSTGYAEEGMDPNFPTNEQICRAYETYQQQADQMMADLPNPASSDNPKSHIWVNHRAVPMCLVRHAWSEELRAKQRAAKEEAARLLKANHACQPDCDDDILGV